MDSHGEQMTAWCLNELFKAGIEGIPIFVLFNKLDIEFRNPGVAVKAQVWDALVLKRDVLVTEDAGYKPLSQSTIGKLAFDHILTSSHGGRVIRAEVQQLETSSFPSPQNPESSIEVQAPVATSAPKRKAADDSSEPPAPKRRGRPPKAKANGGLLKHQPAVGHHVRPKGNSRNSNLQPESLVIEAQSSKTQAIDRQTLNHTPPASDSNDQWSQRGGTQSPDLSTKTAVTSQDQVNTGGNILESGDKTTHFEDKPRPVGQSCVSTIAQNDPVVDKLLADNSIPQTGHEIHNDHSPVLVSNLPEASTAVSESFPTAITIQSQSSHDHMLESGTDGPSIVVEAKTIDSSKSQMVLSEPTKLETPKKNMRRAPKSRRSISPALPEGVYTSQADLDREAGVSGVYIDPTGSQRRDLPPVKGRPAKACITVFKSEKLKDPEWLEARRGTWIEVSAERLASRLIQVEDEAQSPIKRVKRKRQDSIEGAISKNVKKTKVSQVVANHDLNQSPAENSPNVQLQTEESKEASTKQIPHDELSTNVAEEMHLATALTPIGQQLEVSPASNNNEVDTQRLVATGQPVIVDLLENKRDKTSTISQNTAVAPTQILDRPHTSPRYPASPNADNRYSPYGSRADNTSSTSPQGAKGNMAQDSSTLPVPSSTVQRAYLNSPYTFAVTNRRPPSNSHRIAHPFDPSQEITVQKPTVGSHNFDIPNASTNAPRTYVSPFTPIPPPAPTSGYQSPYGTSSYASQYGQPHPSNSPSATPAISNPQQSQWSAPGSSIYPPPKSALKQPNNRSRKQNNKNTVDQEIVEGQSPVHVQNQPQVPTSTLDFHHRYSAMYTPRRQVQGQKVSQQPQIQDPYTQSATQMNISPAFPSRDSWLATISSQSRSKFSAPQPSPSPPQSHSPQVLDPEIANAGQKGDPNLIGNSLGAMENAEKEEKTNETRLSPTAERPLVLSRAASVICEGASLSEDVSTTAKTSSFQPTHNYTRKPQGDEPGMGGVGLLLSPAEAIAVPEGTTRLTCAYEEVVGNLLLPKDMTTLSFFTTDQGLSGSPKFTLPVARISQNPITSMPGSKRMELRVKSKDDDDLDVTHCFLFAPRSSSAEAAANMRAKIVTAMIAYRFRSGAKYDRPDDVEIQHKKKFVCDKCESRFKNINGLQYHQTKSASACNPNYIPKAPKVVPPKPPKAAKTRKTPKTSLSRPRRKGENQVGRTKAVPSKDDDEIMVDSTQELAPEDSDEEFVSPKSSDYAGPALMKSKKQVIEPATDDDGNASDTSQDSFIEWAKQHTTTGVERVPKKTDEPTNERPKNPLRLYKALNNETDVLNGIIKEITASLSEKPEDFTRTSIETPSSLAVAEPSHLRQISNQLLPDHPTDTMSDKLCEEILLAVIRTNDGVFPGDRGLWFACTAVWLTMHAVPTSLPRSTLPSKALDSLLYDQKVERMTFSYQDKRKRHITRSIVYLPGIEPRCPKIDMMKSHIQESTPGYYVPPKFAPPPMVFETLHALASRAIIKKNLLRNGGTIQSQSVEPESSEPESVESESPIAPTPADDDPFDDEDDDDEFVDNVDPALESESDAEAEMDDISSESEEEIRPKGTPHKRKRSEKHNAAISEGLRRRWKDVRAGGDNPFQRGQELIDQPRRTRGTAARLTQEEKDRRAHAAALRQQSWGQAQAFMPNPETGAWNQKPLKTKGKYTNRRLPEPVTYLQDTSTGAWSVRPFGHGVLPIFARPGRRADGNPLAGQYLKRVQNSFRPLVFPKKNRMFLPGPPSKALREAISRQTETGSESVSSKRKSRKKSAFGHFIEQEYDEPSNKRISLATGKPVRGYRRKRDDIPEKEVSSDGELKDAMDLLNMFGGANKQSIRSKAAQKARFMSEVEILNFFEPKKLLPGGKLNPGLETLPPNFGLDPALYLDTEGFLDYGQESELKFRTPRSTDLMSSDLNYASWTMDSLKTSKDVNYNLRWDDQTAFTLQTLPYDQLEDESMPSALDGEVAPPPKRKRVSQGNKWNHSRLLTTHAADFAGIFDDPYEAIEEFDIQMGGSIEQGRKRRQQKQGSTMPPLIEAKFLVVVVMVRTLTGGLDNLVDWVIVHSLFPDMSIDYMRRQYTVLQKTKDLVIERLVVDFQDAFLKAYEKGEVDSLDYDDLPGYDWKKLLDWVLKHVETQMGNKSITLPDTKEEFGDQYNAVILDRDESGWRELFYTPGAAVYKRIEATAAEPHSVPLSAPRDGSADEVTDLLVAKSWLRAIAVTPERDYLASVAKARMDELGKPLANKAFDALVADKTIMHRNRSRATLGRGYEVTEPFFRPLNKYLKDVQFMQAVQYKHWLDQQFLNGATCVRADYLADDGSIMCMTSLQAHGRIKLIAIDVPMDKFGLTEGGYETRQIPRERLRFEMDIYPTSTYLYDFDNAIVNRALSSPPPAGSAKGELPLWFGITDRVIVDLWTKVLMSMGSVLAFRAGTDIVFLRKVFRSTMEEWELKVLLKWGVDVGYFTTVGEKGEAWTVGEWWWLIAGKNFMAGGGEDVQMTGV